MSEGSEITKQIFQFWKNQKIVSQTKIGNFMRPNFFYMRPYLYQVRTILIVCGHLILFICGGMSWNPFFNLNFNTKLRNPNPRAMDKQQCFLPFKSHPRSKWSLQNRYKSWLSITFSQLYSPLNFIVLMSLIQSSLFRIGCYFD